MLPPQELQQLTPYLRQFNMNPTNPTDPYPAKYNGYAAGPWWQGYPVNSVVANNYAGMSVASMGAAVQPDSYDAATDNGATAGAVASV